ncbi:MAG: putative lipopolysaccharide heptosyltransferase III [Nitrospirae bacterium]|nr:putative lipopolysaccharide heptosyltransferase III [Nitrospirota bacterium]MDA1305303.1 putative lipopolysaccharide heptosyltransferase III [Nitrospirota bacterium]
MGGTLENILVIKLRYIGDVLLTTPLLRILRINLAHARITVLVNSGTETILQNNPCVDHVTVLPRGNVFEQMQFLRSIRSCRYDCVIDLSDGDRSAIITAISGAATTIGFNHERRWRGKAYSWSIDGQYGAMHMLDYHAQALIPLGIEPCVCALELNVSDKESQAAEEILATHGLSDKTWIMLHPAARYWFKAWPAERFAALGDALVREGFQVALVGSENEQRVADKVMQSAEQNFVSLVGKTNLRDLAALMKQCSLFVGNDAGPMHIAAAVGCPVVALFGPTDPAVWGPGGPASKVIYKGLDCRECFYPGCSRGEMSCMRQISLEEVINAAKVLLSQK